MDINVLISFFAGGTVCALSTHLTRNSSANFSSVLWSFPFTLIISLYLSGHEKAIEMVVRCSKTSALTFILLNVVANCYMKYNDILISSWFGLLIWITLSLCFI